MKYSITVNELFARIAKVTAENEVDSRIEYLKKKIDFFGEENKHLKNHHNDVNKYHYSKPREEDNYLQGEELVYGDNLYFYYCGHDGFGCIKNFESKDDMEKHVKRYGIRKPDFFYTEIVGVFRYVYQGEEFYEVIDYTSE